MGYEFNLSVDDIQIPEICPVLGIPVFVVDGVMGDNSPSLDRLDPSKGYVKGNVNVISWRANNLKKDASTDELKLIIAYMEGGSQNERQDDATGIFQQSGQDL